MAYLECPTRNDLPSFQYVITLEGTTYTFTFTFNARMGKWFFDLGDEINSSIVSQVPVIATWPLFDRFVERAIPPGTLFAYDSSNTNTDPGRFDLGDRVRIFYAESGTL
jgi:hypothetical protein